MAVNETQPNPNIFVIPEQHKNTLIDYAVKGGLVLLLLWGGKKFYNQWRVNQQEKKAADDPATQQAIKLRTAMEGAGTDEKTIFETAKEITDWEAVTTAYRNLYQANVTEDLKDDLSAEEYQKFFNIINLTQRKPDQKIKTSVEFSKGRIAISKAQVNIRKTPRASGSQTKDKLLVFGRSNIITTIDAGIAAGITTGRTMFDEKAEPSGVLFIEITVLKKNAPVKDAFTAWVAASQIETLTGEQYKLKRNPALSITKEQYDDASASLNGTELGANYRREIVTISPTYILNDKFQAIGEAAKNIILGFPIMELNTPNEDYVKFLTIDDTQRWVKKKHIKTIEK